jgi:hypothetical protein
MSGADNSTVSIVIRVIDDSGAIKNVETKLSELGTAGTATNAKVAGMGSAAKQAGAEGAAAFASMGAAATEGAAGASGALGSMHGNMREVSGTARELGVNMGYSMRSFLAQSPAVMGALRAMSGLFIGIAAVEIGTQFIEGIYHLYEKWLDVNAAVDQYAENVKKTQQEDIVNVRSLEDATLRLHDLNTEFTTLASFSKGMAGEGWAELVGAPGAGLAKILSARKVAEAGATAGTQGDVVTEKQLQMQHQLREAQIATAHAGDAALGPQAKITAEMQKQLAIHAEEQRFTKLQDEHYGNRTAADSGKGLQDEKDRAARATAGAQGTIAARSENERIISAQNAAIAAGATGEARYAEQAQADVDAIVRKFKAGQISEREEISVTRSLDMAYHNEKMRRLEEEQYQTSRIEQEAAQAGLTGVAKIQTEGNTRVTDLWDNPANRDVSEYEKQKRGIGLEKQTDAEILEARKHFQEEMDQLSQRSDAQMQTGYARISSVERGAQARIGEDFSKGYGQLPSDDPERVAAEQRAQNAIGIVQQNAERERQQLTQRDNQEIAKMESETAQLSLPPWLAAQQRIRDQYDETRQHAQADLDAQLSYFKELAQQQGALTSEQAAAQAQVWNQYYQRVTADADRANAEMQKQSEQTRDQLAGQLSSFFDNPAKYMENRAKQLMMDIVANWVMQLTESKGPMGSAMAWLFGMGPEMSTSTNPKTALGSVFGGHTAAHGAAGAIGGSHTLDMAGSTLSSAGSTLSSAGSTLSSSGTMLATAADALSSAAGQIGSMTAGNGAGGGAGAGISGGGTGGVSMGPAGDLADAIAGGTSQLSSDFQPSDMNAAPTSASGVAGTPPGGAPSAGAIGQSMAALSSAIPGAGTAMGGASLFSTLAKGGVFGADVQHFMGGATTQGGAASAGGTGATGAAIPSMGLLNTSGDFQPSDLNAAPTGATGVTGVPPGEDMSGVAPAPGEHVVADMTSEGTTMPADSGVQSSGGGIGAMGIAGAGMAALSGGMAMAQDWQAGKTGAAVLTGAMTGASIGSMFGPIEMGVGAAVGALVGLIGGLFSDHGASKMRKYNEEQVQPAILKEMTSYTAAEVGYEQAMQDMNSLQSHAMVQAEAWGSGAVGVFRSKVMPEINVAIQEIGRQQQADRSGAIGMQAAQYDSGGVISSFGDFSTGPFSGFIHARMGETVMNPIASMVHGPSLSAMNRGVDPSAYLPRGGGSGMGGSVSGGGGDVHLHVHAIDAQDVARWLRTGAAVQIQSALNSNVNRYAGRSLG